MNSESGRKICGLIVNPVAGMGGSVGLKGTDGDSYTRALTLGARPVSPGRAQDTLKRLQRGGDIRWLAAPGDMGANHLAAAGFDSEVTGSTAARTTGADTKRIAAEMVVKGAELIVFAGGDGTARDIADAVGVTIPVVAIPSGVKIYSAVFAVSPLAAAGLIDAFVESADCAEEEVLDIDEDAFREGEVASRHHAFLRVPEVRRLLQGGKESSGMAGGIAEAKQDLALVVVEQMIPGTLYLLGCGTTLQAVADALGIRKTLLGIDAVLDRQLVAEDLNEHSILELLDENPDAKILLTPLGGNGFILGRGNKPFTPEVIRRAGRENLIIIANREKLLSLSSLRVDTGDAELDRSLAGYMDVVVGLNFNKIMKVQ